MGRNGAINAKVHATKSRRNFSLRTHPIHTMEPKTHVLLHFIMFGCIWDRFVTALTRCKWAYLVQLMQKFGSRSRIWTCHYEHARSTPLDPKSCFRVFRNIWVHSGPFRYCTKIGAKWAELVQLMQKFMPRKSCRNFSLQTRPIHNIGL